MNPGNLARALNQSHPRPFPVVNSHTVGGRGSGVGLEPQPMMYPVMVVPYGGSYMYVPAQPVAYYNPYAPFRGTMPTMASYSSYGHSEAPTSVYRPHSSFKENKKGFVRKNHSMGNTVAINPLIDSPVFPQIQNYGFNSTLREEDAENYEEDEVETESVAGPRSADTMTVEELYRHITNHLKSFPRIRISWFNKLLVKVQTPQEFARALDTLEVFTQRIIDVSPETGTLFIKAACRAKVPEKALLILKALDKVRIWPTLGGIHYLMINFALKNDTQSVKEAFRVAKLRELKPNVRTYQIIIRECVDNNLIDDALGYLTECETLNIIPNRVTYNILMNGLRKANRPKEILQIRQKMDKHGLEINDTTVKFTSMAYMMLGDAQNAVTEFLKYPDVATKMSEFSSKFFELTEGPDALQKKCVVDLFDALAARGVAFPADLQEQLQKAKSAGWA